jgi:GAF domain-containing protein
VTFPAGEVGSNAAESIELLAANAAAALGRVEREAELSRRGDALEERSRRLERLSEFNDLLRRINAALVDAGTLTAVATAVCNHLADADGVALAWLGETYRGGSLTPVARAGDPDGYLDDVVGDADSPSSAGPAAEPTLRALASGEPVTVADVSGNLRGSPWRERALVRGYQSVASVPLAYNGLEYGVLSVYADRPGAFDGVLGDLLAELGDTIANAINGIEVKRSLRGESLVELDLRVADPDALLVRAAAALDAPVRVDGGVAGGEDRSVVYLESESDPVSLPEAVLAVEEVRSVGDGDDPRAEVTVTDPTLVDRLTDYGASLDTVRADADGLDATVRLPRSADVRGLIEALEERYRAVELRARRERAADADGSGLSTALEERLTDRQREAVRTAYLSGYFEWPRASTGEEVAAALGITQPTFNRHLRTTERTLFSLLFDEGEQTD